MAELQWTDKAPTEPGWYWFRALETEMVLRIVRLHETLYAVVGTNVYEADDSLGEWAGPIPEPQEPEETDQ